MIQTRHLALSQVEHHARLDTLRKLMADAERRGKRHCIGEVVEPAGRRARGTPRVHAGLVSGMEMDWHFGVASMDQALPEYGLHPVAVHEVSGAGYADTAQGSAFMLALLRRLGDACRVSASAPVLWCQTGHARQEFGRIYGCGLAAFGFHPDQFIFAEVGNNRDILWALEEGARASGLLAVVGEVQTATFTQTRRLALAAESGTTPVLLLRPHDDRTASAAETRWRIASVPGAPDPYVATAPGNPRWRVELSRCRGGRPGAWTVEWNNEAHRFHLVEEFSARSSQPAGVPVSAGQYVTSMDGGTNICILRSWRKSA